MCAGIWIETENVWGSAKAQSTDFKENIHCGRTETKDGTPVITSVRVGNDKFKLGEEKTLYSDQEEFRKTVFVLKFLL